jgi:pimeloyl-ACP methyl ester carboxylesterase
MTTPLVPPENSPRFQLWNEVKFLFHVGRPHRVELFRTGTSKTKHVILLHGWHSTERQMRAWHQVLAEADGERSVWRVTYDTHWKSFQRSARLIMAELKKQKVDWDDVVLVGYSMGGIVARQMVAYGFPARCVICLCSPHHGALGWSRLRFPILSDPGAATLTQWSRSLRALNSHPRDRAARQKYHLMAVTYHDRRGDHDNDGIVGQDSALGEWLGDVGSRTTLHFDYGQRPGFFTDPHILGMVPGALPAMRERVVKLLSGQEPPEEQTVEQS